MGAAFAGGMILLLLVFMLVMFALCILVIIAEWKLFQKAGQPGWAAIVPFYNAYVLTKITWGIGWLFLLGFLPIGNIVFLILTWIRLARVFGKGGGYAAGLIFLPYIFLPMLAFGKSAVYQGPDEKSWKGPVIACAVVGGLGTALFGALLLVGGTAVVIQSQDAPYGYEDEETDEDSLYDDDSDDRDSDDSDDADDIYDDSDDIYDGMDDGEIEGDGAAPDYDGSSDEVETSPIEGYEHFVSVAIADGETQVSVPVVDGEYMSAYGSIVTSFSDGVTTQVYVGSAYAELTQMVSDAVESSCELMEEMPEYYDDITVDEMIAGDGFALQQINYNSVDWEEKEYPCIEIVKCDQVDGGVVMLSLSVDNSSATADTQAVFKEACELYGIDFDFD
ncbi:MAG TPA: hypothetical protein H9799_08600 [Candidatus Mediterraneibacter merdipullorum]|nr:hypothetical protein [Candidatus Mediterraneibacter merdipullorum]